MARTATITLDDKQFTIHALNLGEMEEATAAFEGPSNLVAYRVIEIAMRRAEPKLNGELKLIEPTFDQVNAAFRVIVELSGLSLENPPQPPAVAAS